MKIIFKKKLLSSFIIVLLVSLISLLIYSISIYNSSMNFYVSTTGSDSNNGTLTHPFKTLAAARDTIRKTYKNKKLNKNINIFIRGGNYFTENTFNLEKIDSGNKNFSITYKNYKNEQVFLNGGYSLKDSDFKTITDKTILDSFINKEAAKKIFVADLSKYPTNFNTIDDTISNAPELFYNDEAMSLSMYPNNGFLTTEKVNSKSKNNGYSFIYSGSEPSLWNKNEPIYMSGYWFYDWSDSTVKISNIDTSRNMVLFNDNLPYGIKNNQRYYFFNILEELDKEGEYYIDYNKNLLYFLPNTPLKNSKIQLSLLKEPFIKMKDVSNVTIEGINFENSRGTDITIENGENNKIKNCIIRNSSQNAVSINGGINNGVENCKIYNTGTGGITINGGNRTTLTPCNNYASNNEIYNYSRIVKTYSSAINISGVGINASHNCIHDAPHTAILFSGNDNLLEYNEIYNVAKETDDVGAIYTGRDWTFRGNIVRYNYLHNIDNNIGNFDVSGVYLDDCMSSAEVYGNIFYKVKNPIFIGGGRDNIIKNNIILDCKNSINFDERGLTWNLDQLYANLKKVPYEGTIWVNKYPELKDLFKDGNPGIPNNNIIENNILFKTIAPSISKSVITYGTVKNNILYNENPGFKNYAKMNFQLNNNSIIFKEIKDFKNIPFEKIGRKS